MSIPRNLSVHTPAAFSHFGAYLRFLRRRARLTQRELAIAVNYSEGQICHLERGRRAPELATLAALFVPALQLEQAPEEAAQLLRLAAAHHAAQPRHNAPVHQPNMLAADAAMPTAQLDTSLYGLPLLGPLIGRVQQRIDLAAALQSGTLRLLTLLGPPGVGKTHLALQLGHDVQAGFADGVHFVNLEPITDPALVVPAIAQALELGEDSSSEPLERLKLALHKRRCLLILDNIEHVLGCGPQLVELLQAAPHLVVLSTSRVALQLQIEQLVVIQPLAIPDLAYLPDLETLAQIESVALLLARLRAVQPNLELSAANALALAAICVRVDGLPLALELVASRGRLLSPQELLTEVAQHFQQLQRRGRDVPARHRTLRAALHWSYAQLSEGARTLFARLSVFVGQWCLEAVEPICDLEQLGRVQILDYLDELIKHSLLQRQTLHESTYLSMLAMMREYAQEQLAMRGESGQLRERLLAAYMTQAEQAEPHLVFGAQQAYWMARLHMEYDSMRAGLEWALASENYVEGMRLAGALWRFWYMRGMLREGRRWLEKLLEVKLEGHALVRAHALDGLGILVWRQGEYQHADTCFQQALELYQAEQYGAGVARVLSHIGMAKAEHGAFEQAMLFYERSLPFYRELGDSIGASTVLHNLANLYCQQNQHERAMEYYQECLAIYEQHNSQADIALISLGMGAVARDQGRGELAEAAFQRSLELARSLGDGWTEATALLNLGDSACDQADFSTGQQRYNAAHSIFERLGDQQMLAVVQARLGQLLLLSGDAASALGPYRQCLMLSNALGFQPGIADGLEGIASCMALLQPMTAAKLLAAAAALRESISLPISLVEQARHQHLLSVVQDKLGTVAWASAWQQGLGLELAQAMSLALTLA